MIEKQEFRIRYLKRKGIRNAADLRVKVNCIPVAWVPVGKIGKSCPVVVLQKACFFGFSCKNRRTRNLGFLANSHNFKAHGRSMGETPKG